MPFTCCLAPDLWPWCASAGSKASGDGTLLMRAWRWGAQSAQSVGFVRVCERRTMVGGVQLCRFFGFPSVHEPCIKHHDGHENQQRALCGHPKIKRPTMDVDRQIACKKTRPKTGQKPNRQQCPLQTVLTFFQRGRWRVNFRHAQGYAKTHGVCMRRATPIFGVYPSMQCR